MYSFKQYLNEAKNTHLEHLEDEIINNGYQGGVNAVEFLKSIRNMLIGSSRRKLNVSVKWDGAPAVFCGVNPENGKFFVGSKSVFNVNPKINYTPADIRKNHTGGLVEKLEVALKELSKFGIKGVIQGDFLFSKKDLSTKKFDGVPYVTFHPNTIIYAVPVDQASEIKKAKIGIVWHTTYTGKDFESMRASYGVDVSKFRRSVNVWSQDAMLRDVQQATMSKKETERVNQLLSKCGLLFNKISGTTLRELEGKQHIATLIEQFNNTFVRKGAVIGNTSMHVTKLIKWIQDKYQKEIDKRKTAKGKGVQQQKLDEILEFFSVDNKKALVNMIELQKTIVLAKLILINKLDRLKKIDTFVQTTNGYKTTGEEGYVAIDTLGGDAVKLVDRMEFSYNNFSPDVVKGWDKPSRN